MNFSQYFGILLVAALSGQSAYSQIDHDTFSPLALEDCALNSKKSTESSCQDLNARINPIINLSFDDRDAIEWTESIEKIVQEFLENNPQ